MSAESEFAPAPDDAAAGPAQAPVPAHLPVPVPDEAVPAPAAARAARAARAAHALRAARAALDADTRDGGGHPPTTADAAPSAPAAGTDLFRRADRSPGPGAAGGDGAGPGVPASGVPASGVPGPGRPETDPSGPAVPGPDLSGPDVPGPDASDAPPQVAPTGAPGPVDDQAVELAPYTIPQVPAIGWDPAPSPRRRWIARGVLAAVLVIQALLSLRLLAAAHPDEAAAMVAGRQQLDHLLHGTPVTTHLAERIPGTPQLYLPLAGAAADANGIFGARVLSLCFALLTTVLLYSLTRRLFNERVAICSIAGYAVVQSTVVVGFYAAPEALAVLLVALAAWVTVFTARRPVALVLLAAPVAALACAVAYSAVFTLPALVALAAATAWPRRRLGPAALRALLLAAGTVGALLPFGLLGEVAGWSPAHGQGSRPVGEILLNTVQWGGLFTVLAVAGTIAYARREQLLESPENDGVTTTRAQRALLGTALTCTALLVPAVHLALGTSGALFRHLGFGMLLAAPLAGVGLTRLVGAHFRHPQLGILVWVALLALGLEQSALRYQNGPDSGRLLAVLRVHATPQGHYLTEVDGLPEYYLGAVSRPEQWTSARSGTDYRDAAGVEHHGDEGSAAAIKDGYFTVVVLDSTAPAATDRVLATALASGGHYRLIAQFTSPTGDSSTYKVYLKH
ncbi:glycosyltransferase family 39 protein [Kitasatospora sp. NPDC101176]|uniref:glycosyltransferase family 39 protein n=1 Tax=Kitasatospora sp. NPDC101176 TaxID=3364099 RepID=UPI003814E00E